MLVAAIDTETTGIIRGDYTNPDAPYIAAITIIIYDTERSRVQASFNTMIQPDGWEMPPEAGAVNGLDTETLAEFGIPAQLALHTTAALFEPCSLLIAHNAAFDVKMLASAFYRNDMLDSLESILAKDVYCTMQESKDVVQAKNKAGRLKLPKLTEAYEYFFDKPLDNAHSANADTVACLEIWLALQNQEDITL